MAIDTLKGMMQSSSKCLDNILYLNKTIFLSIISQNVDTVLVGRIIDSKDGHILIFRTCQCILHVYDTDTNSNVWVFLLHQLYL